MTFILPWLPLLVVWNGLPAPGRGDISTRDRSYVATTVGHGLLDFSCLTQSASLERNFQAKLYDARAALAIHAGTQRHVGGPLAVRCAVGGTRSYRRACRL